MSMEKESILVRWHAVNSEVPFNEQAALCRAFVEDASMGSPLEPERPLASGGVAQAFSGGVYKWTEENGVELVDDPTVLDYADG